MLYTPAGFKLKISARNVRWPLLARARRLGGVLGIAFLFLMISILSWVAVLFLSPPVHAQGSDRVMIVLQYAMPQGQPDIRHARPEPDIETCWADAKEFVARGVPRFVAERGGLAVGAMCLVKGVPESQM
jgi:hypothetical protein